MDNLSLLYGDFFKLNLDEWKGRVNLFLTDLPYGTIRNSQWDTDFDLDAMWERVRELAAPESVLLTTASQPFTSKVVMSNLDQFQCSWVWDKKLADNGFLAKKQPLKVHEDVLVFQLGKSVVYYPQMQEREKSRKKVYDFTSGKGHGTIKSGVRIEKENNLYYPTTILEASVAHLRGARRFHLAQKPLSLANVLIRTYSRPGDVVMDFCMGSGSMLIPAIELGRTAVGIEVQDDVYDTAVQRILDHFKEPDPLPIFADQTESTKGQSLW